MALPHDDPRLSDYVAMARRQWPVVVGVTLVVVLLGALVAFLLPQPAKARALVALQSETRPLPEGGGPPPDASLELAVARSLEVQELVEDGLDAPPDVEVAQVADRPLLTITASASDEEEAVHVANAYAAAFIEVRNEQAATALQAGLEAVQERLRSLTSAPPDDGGTAVDPAELAQLRLAAELLGEAATSGDLAAVEAAAEQVQRAAAEPLVTDDALLLVRETRLEQLSDQLVVAISAQEAAGPRVVVEAEPVDAVGGLGAALPVALVAGALLGLALGLVRELRDPTVHLATELPGRTGGAPVVAELRPGGPGVHGLRAAVLLALPAGGVLHVATVSAGADDAVADALAESLRAAEREVVVVDVRPPGEGQAPGTPARASLAVPVGHDRFADLLAEHGSRGRLALVLSPPAHQPGDAGLVAHASDCAVLAVVPGHDFRLDVARATDTARRTKSGFLGTVTVLASEVEKPGRERSASGV